MSDELRVAVIGGGAAGMMAAYAAGSAGHSVTLFEKNEKLGKKIYITGKGRCNFTNMASPETFFQNVATNPKFLYAAFYGFSNEDMVRFVEEHGVPTKVERGNRAFPASDHASDITLALKRAMDEVGVTVRLNTEVERVRYDRDGSACTRGVRLVDGTEEDFDRVIVCTGGLSYPATGSTGDGYRFAEATGHKIIACRPALVPLEAAEDYVKDLQGLSLRNVTFRVFASGVQKTGNDKTAYGLNGNGKGKRAKSEKLIFEEFGELLFTHFGISGPLVLSASSILAARSGKASSGDLAARGGKTEKEKTGFPYRAEIDLKPALSDEQLEARLMRELSANENKTFYNAVSSMLPKKMLEILPRMLSIAEDKRVNQITKEERTDFLRVIRHFPLTLTGTRGFHEAIITHGGVSVKDINPSTMESKCVKGLYFAGEVLDLDALTGGYNLQIAFSTGHLAGMSV